MHIPGPLPPLSGWVLRVYKEMESLPSSSPPFCSRFIFGSGPSILISCDKKVWREQVRLVPKSMAVTHTSAHLANRVTR